jgi:hypothetical protein
MARPKGALGKNKAFLLNRLQAMYGKAFDPVMKMAEQAVTLDKLALEEPSVTNQKESIHAWGKIAEFVTPKLKATEITTGDSGLTVSIQRKKYDGSVTDTEDV